MVTQSTCHKLTKSGAFKLVNFTNATLNSDGSKECVNTTGIIEMYDKKPIHECLHKDVEQCHHTYVTEFEPIQEEVCDENYQKSCQVSTNIHSRKTIFIFHSTLFLIVCANLLQSSVCHNFHTIHSVEILEFFYHSHFT